MSNSRRHSPAENGVLQFAAGYVYQTQVNQTFVVSAGLDRATGVWQDQVHELQRLQAQVQSTEVY